MHGSIHQCYLHIWQDMLHGVSGKKSQIGRCKQHTLDRLKRQSQQSKMTVQDSLTKALESKYSKVIRSDRRKDGK